MNPDDIFRALEHTCAATIELQFKQFIDSGPSPKWLIASDFAMADQTRFNDVLVYTLYPYNQTLDSVCAVLTGHFFWRRHIQYRFPRA